MTPNLDRRFRRRRFRGAHRRPTLWRVFVRPGFLALLIAAVPAAATTWLLTSPTFEFHHLELETGERVSGQWVSRALAPLQGRPLATLPLRDAQERILRHAWARGAEVRKRLPDRLVVKVLEREPAALLEREGVLHYVDTRGYVVEPVPAGSAVGAWLVLAAEAAEPAQLAQAVEAVARLEASQRRLGRVHRVELLGLGDARVFFEELSFPVLVAVPSVDEGLAKIHRFLPEIQRRYHSLERVDFRFSRQIVIELSEA